MGQGISKSNKHLGGKLNQKEHTYGWQNTVDIILRKYALPDSAKLIPSISNEAPSDVNTLLDGSTYPR